MLERAVLKDSLLSIKKNRGEKGISSRSFALSGVFHNEFQEFHGHFIAFYKGADGQELKTGMEVHAARKVVRSHDFLR